MKIVSYNLHMGLEPEAIVKNIKDFAAQGVDIFCLQEFWKWMQPTDLEVMLMSALGPDWQMEYKTPDKPLHDYGACILWNSAVLQPTSFRFLSLPLLTKTKLWERAFVRLKGFGPEAYISKRGALIGIFHWNGQNIRITSLHLDWAGGFRQRAAQITYLRDILSCEPAADYEIICGDFNTLGIFNKARQTKMILDILGNGFQRACTAPGVTCPPLQHLDHMFVKNLKVRNFKICKIPGSDHFPILADLNV